MNNALHMCAHKLLSGSISVTMTASFKLTKEVNQKLVTFVDNKWLNLAKKVTFVAS